MLIQSHLKWPGIQTSEQYSCNYKFVQETINDQETFLILSLTILDTILKNIKRAQDFILPIFSNISLWKAYGQFIHN